MKKETLKTSGASLTIYFHGPSWQDKPTATLGDLSFKEPAAGTELLDEALKRLRAEGYTQVLGPMSGDTWHSYRFVSESDGSPAFLLEPDHAPHELAILKAAGFQPVAHYFSARIALTEAEHEAPPTTDAFHVTAWDGKNPEELFREVFALSAQAFANNAFYTPISEEDFLAMYLPLVPLMVPELIFFARCPKGSLVGYLFALPNYANGQQETSVILKTYASLVPGAGRHLVHAFHGAAQAKGYQSAIYALIHDDNKSAERSRVEGGEVFRRYELLGLRLNA